MGLLKKKVLVFLVDELENTLKFGRCKKKKNKVSQLIFTYGKVSLSLLTCAQSESQLIQSVLFNEAKGRNVLYFQWPQLRQHVLQT